ncbi:MAG: type II toxin-antitoxin system VapC family toxin [Burkholderiaceae bacterium]|nr:type II toxin-antitoxin system VapC family toxin [Burkholderiaceae bacterium]
MSFNYLLDTNIISHMMKNPQGMVAQRIQQITENALSSGNMAPLCTSVIVQSELLYGLIRNPSARLRTAYDTTMKYIPVLALESTASAHYSQLRTALEAQGTPIGPNDTFIAAQTLALGYTLVTDNEDEFRRVVGLKVENWTK